MKKNILSWMTIMLMAFVCVGFAACGDDDDNGGGSGAGSMKFNGKSYNLAYGFWQPESSSSGSKYTSFEFANFDLTTKNPSAIPARADMMYFNISGISSPEPGTYDTSIEIYSFSTREEGVNYPGGGGKVKVTIAKSGDKYTFTIPETTVYYYENGSKASPTTAPFSFSWTGKLVQAHFSE